MGLTVQSRTNRAKLRVADNDSNAYVVAEAGKAFFGTSSNGDATNITVLTSGDVGIGTDSPKAKFEVVGGANISSSATGASSTTLRIGSYSASAQTYYGAKLVAYHNYTASTATDLAFEVGTIEAMRIDSSGNVEMGSKTWKDYANNPIGALNIEKSSSATDALILYNPTEDFQYLAFRDSQANGSQYCRIGWSSGSSNAFTIINMGNTALYILSNGNVGIKKTSGISYELDVSGTIRATSDVIAFSDRRVKENIVTIDSALEKVTKLRGVSYNRKDIKDKSTKIGVIAQEVLEVLPEVVSKDDEGKYSVAYGNMAGVFIEAIKELENRIKELENKSCNCKCK